MKDPAENPVTFKHIWALQLWTTLGFGLNLMALGWFWWSVVFFALAALASLSRIVERIVLGMNK